MNLSGVGTARCVLVWATTSTASAAALGLLAPDLATVLHLPDHPASVSFERWLVTLSALVAACCVLWCWLVTTVVVAQTLDGRPHAETTGVVPDRARRLVLVACGLAVLTVTAAPAQASATEDDESVARLLDGLPLPDRAEGPSVAETIGRRLARVVRTPAPAVVHVVRRGESLWSIAQRSLAAAERADDAAAVTAYWRRIHSQNRARIGSDPDLLHPGQRLRLPPPGKEPR